MKLSGKHIKLLILICLLIAWLIVFAGCKKKTESIAGAAEIVQKTCPVMGNPINKDIYVEYQGKKVYFCCPECKDKFEQEPEKYISKLPQFSKQ